jgi:hypothetical protein
MVLTTSGPPARKLRIKIDFYHQTDTKWKPQARLVAKVFSQRPGIDYNETYASVVTHDTI